MSWTLVKRAPSLSWVLANRKRPRNPNPRRRSQSQRPRSQSLSPNQRPWSPSPSQNRSPSRNRSRPPRRIARRPVRHQSGHVRSAQRRRKNGPGIGRIAIVVQPIAKLSSTREHSGLAVVAVGPAAGDVGKAVEIVVEAGTACVDGQRQKRKRQHHDEKEKGAMHAKSPKQPNQAMSQ